MSKWFLKEEDLKPKKKERVTDPDEKLVSTTALTRILAMSDLYEEGRIKNGLYCSSIGCDQYFDMTKEILDYWSPKEPKKREYSKEQWTEQSNVKHLLIQEHLHSAKVLHRICDSEGKFKEPRAEFTSHGITGKIDLILPNPEYLSALGAKTPKKLPKIEYWFASDIKETDSGRIKGIGSRLSQSYRTQLSLYCDWFHRTHGGHEKKAGFWYLNRDNPKQFKLIGFEKDQNLIELSKKRAGIFWEHINNKTLPNDDSDSAKEIIEKMIEENDPQRIWKHETIF